MQLIERNNYCVHWAELTASTSFAALLNFLPLAYAQEATPVPPVSVTAPAPSTPPGDGTVAAGYRVDTVTSLGPFTNTKLQDTPYTVNVLSSDFLENSQSYNMPETFADKLPSFQIGSADQKNPTTGVGSFRGNVATDQQLINGLPVPTTSSVLFLEPYQRVEALSSVSGFMYGVGSSTGKFNYVLKRPIDEPFFADITTGVLIGTSPYAHVDLGGTTANNRIGYRINIVGQDGNTNVDTETQRKYLVSAALDLHLSNSVLLQFDGLYSQWYGNIAPNWLLGSGVKYSTVTPPDPTKLWSEPWSYAETRTGMIGANLQVDFTNNVTSRTAVRFVDSPYSAIETNNTIQSNNTYNQRVIALSGYDRYGLSGYQYFDFNFDTYSIKHKVTMGFLGSWYQEKDAQNDEVLTSSSYFSGLPLTSPVYNQNPNLVVATLPTYVAQDTYMGTAVLGDEISFTKNWSALLGVAYSEITDKTFNADSTLASNYNAGKLTPTGALLYKPVDNVTLYGSYVQGLQEGLAVSGSQFTNNGSILPPYLREQYEVGLKATVGNVLYTIALFQINSALQYSVQNADGTLTEEQNGRQRNRGIETAVTGEVLPGVRMLGGISYIDARVTQDYSSPNFVGSNVPDVARWLIKDTVEYDLPFYKGLTVTGGAYYTSDFYADQPNTDKIPGRVTFDAGLRYTTKVYEHPLIARFNVSNITDARYWVYNGTVGDPRRFAGSVEWKF